MPIFAYRAADRRGQTIDGVMEAPDARAVVERLHREAYFPIEVVPQTEQRGVLGLAWPGSRPSRVRGRELVGFTRELATLLEAGMPVDRALAILEELTASPRMRTIVGDVLHSVRGGSSLGEALAKHHPRPFSRLYINMVRAGEKGGVLEPTLRRLADFLEEAQEFREALVSALIYPALLTGVGSAAVVFLLTFVIPRFADIFRDLGQAMPVPTQILLAVSGSVQRYWWLILLGGLAAALAARVWLATPTGRLQWDGWLLRFPLIGDVVTKTQVARFARVLGTLLKSGVPVISALAVVKDMLSNAHLVQAVDFVTEGVRRGAGMWSPMSEARIFPPLAVHMVRVGEETGRLEDTLLKVAATLEADVKRLVKRLTGLVEPVIILVMGLVVGFIVVAMLMAIFSISDIPL
jgi:general secretion pathway protein F